MKNSETNSTKTPESLSHQGIIKSQKILNSLSNFHLKTENDRSDQDQKSPNNGKEKIDFRESWRKPKIPYNKLLPPEAFYNQKKKKSHREMLKNIDKMVEHNEYKEAQKLLQPLKIVKEEEKKKEAGENRNPLLPYKKYQRIVSKFNQDLKNVHDTSMEKFRPYGRFNAQIKLNDCITLHVLKRGSNTGTIKKMLHVPTLRSICVRQQPINSKQSRNAIRDWISLWNSKLNQQNSPFLGIYEWQFNYPEGALSILTQYMKGGSLLDLLNTVLTLPQSVIHEVFSQIINQFNVFYSLTDLSFGGISPSQVLFTEESQIKLGLGLFYRFPSLEGGSVYHIDNKPKQQSNWLQFNNTHTKFMKNNTEKNINLELQRSIDIFKLGMMVLQSAIGSFDMLQQSAIIQEVIKLILSQQGQKIIQQENVCCVIHSETYLLQLVQQEVPDYPSRDKKDYNNIIHYIRLLKDRYSVQFMTFLCHTLRLHHHRRATLEELQSHPFITGLNHSDNQTAKVTLEEILSIGRGFNQDKIYQSTSVEKLDKFIGHVEHVLCECNRDVLVNLLVNQKNRIYSLGKEIGLNPDKLGDSLYEVIIKMIKIEK